MSDLIRIVPPKPNDDGQIQSAVGTRVYDANGNEMEHVVKLVVLMSAEELLQAEVTVPVHMEEVWAYPFMSEENFLKAAKHYGYWVEKIRD